MRGAEVTGAGGDVVPRALTPLECWALLRAHVVGRIAVVSGDQPLVVPMNYAVDGDALVVRTGEGEVHDAAVGAQVAFQLDHFDDRDHSGWSVLVRGRAAEVGPSTAPRLARDTRSSGVEPWAPGRREHWLRIVPQHVSGRLVPPLSWGGHVLVEGYL